MPRLDFQYQYPQAFYLLLLLPLLLLLFLGYQLWKRRKQRALGDPALVQALLAGHSRPKTILKFALLFLAFAAGCLAVANPRRPDETSAEARKGIDLVIALDISNSMLATDIAPNRLARAKQFINRLVDGLKDDRIGLVVFAGNAYVQMPLTFDQSAAKMYVAAASPVAIATQGTRIGDALKKADITFGEVTDRFRSIVLITDGETHDEDAPEKVKELAGKGIMINTVGLGSPEGTTILDTATGRPRVDESGQVVISQLNEKLLQELASTTNGVYVHLENAESAVALVMEQYKDIEKKALGDASLFTYETYYHWLVAPMLLLLLLEMFLSDRKKQSL
jgi:Ca-activated chloride channel family protein